MIKKILKLTVAVMTLGLFTTSVFAADWGVSGQVRVDWDVSKTVQNDTTTDDEANGIAAGTSRTPNGVIIQEGDSYVQFDLGEENVSAYLRYYPGGNEEYGGSASAESGEWTANAVVSTRNYIATADPSAREGYTKLGSRSGDTHVKIKHASGFSILLGYTTALDGWRRGRANLLLGDTGGTVHIQGDAPSANSDALDNRAQIVDIGILNSDTLSIGLVIEQKDSGEAASFGAAFGGLTFGNYQNISAEAGDQVDNTFASDAVTAANDAVAAAIVAGNLRDSDLATAAAAQDRLDAINAANTANSTVQSGVASTNIGIRAGVKAGPLDLGLTFVSGSEAGDASLGGNPAYKASGTALGLGVGLNLGAITPFLNIWMPSTTSENQFGKDEITTSNTNIGVDYALNDTSGVSFSSVTRESTVTTAGGETKTKKAAIELGYNTNIGGSAVKVGFVNATETDASEKEVTVSWLRVRFQQSF